VEELRGAVRGGEEVLLHLYRAEGKGEGARPRRWRRGGVNAAASSRRSGGGGGARGGKEQRDGRGVGAAVGRKERPEVGDDPDRWAPLVSERVREKDRWAKWMLMGRGRNGPSAGKRKRKGGGMGCWAGWWEWVR
jgi:hypothetical protein